MITHIKPNANNLPGFWDIKETPILQSGNLLTKDVFLTEETSNTVQVIHGLLSQETCENLIEMFNRSGIEAPVSVNGLKDENFGVGSKRASGWSEYIANQLTDMIIPKLPVLSCNAYTATDWWQGAKQIRRWKPIAVSPLLRFMRYQHDSEHYAHYDAGYLYPDGQHRTLKSLVIYLTTNEIGATRFLDDGQDNLHVWNRKHQDWSRRAEKSEIRESVYPVAGSAVVFNHRLCHDVEQFQGADKVRIIIRGDIIYEPA